MQNDHTATNDTTHIAPTMTAISSTARTGSREASVTIPKPSRVLPAGSHSISKDKNVNWSSTTSHTTAAQTYYTRLVPFFFEFLSAKKAFLSLKINIKMTIIKMYFESFLLADQENTYMPVGIRTILSVPVSVMRSTPAPHPNTN